jgi:hypothetical protein
MNGALSPMGEQNYRNARRLLHKPPASSLGPF